MNSVTLPVSNLEIEGPIVDVSFSIPNELDSKLKIEDKKIPNPILVKAMIDTGSSHCVIQENIPKQLGLSPVGATGIRTATGRSECYLYFLRMSIPKHNFVYEGVFTAVTLEAQQSACLIGRDLLSKCTFIYNGPKNEFTLDLSK